VGAPRPPHGRPHRLPHGRPAVERRGPVNQLDILLVILIVTGVVGGYRLGFLARATSWIGLIIGLLGASYFLPDIVKSLQSYQPSSRFLIASGVFLGAAFLGQAIGLVLGANLHRALPLRGPPGPRPHPPPRHWTPGSARRPSAA